MKKKLKDLTKEELDKYCDKHSCSSCPLREISLGNIVCLATITGREEQEVEVDE